MSIALIFWILMLLWFVAGLFWNWPGNAPPAFYPLGNALLIFILFLLLGWATFGAPVRG